MPTASANKVPEREAALLVGSAGSLAFSSEDDEQQQSGLLGTGQRDSSTGPAGKRLRVQTLLEESRDAGRGQRSEVLPTEFDHVVVDFPVGREVPGGFAFRFLFV